MEVRNYLCNITHRSLFKFITKYMTAHLVTKCDVTGVHSVTFIVEYGSTCMIDHRGDVEFVDSDMKMKDLASSVFFGIFFRRKSIFHSFSFIFRYNCYIL